MARLEKQGGEAKSATKSPALGSKFTLGVQLELQQTDPDLKMTFSPCRCSKTCAFWTEGSQDSVLGTVCIPHVKIGFLVL